MRRRWTTCEGRVYPCISDSIAKCEDVTVASERLWGHYVHTHRKSPREKRSAFALLQRNQEGWMCHFHDVMNRAPISKFWRGRRCSEVKMQGEQTRAHANNALLIIVLISPPGCGQVMGKNGRRRGIRRDFSGMLL